MSNNVNMFEDGISKFGRLKRESGKVEYELKKSLRRENSFVNALWKYLKAGLIALRTARVLVPASPSDEDLRQQIHSIVDEVFDDVVKALEQDKNQA